MLISIGKILLTVGLFLVVIGGILMLANKIPFLGRLPGDILIQRRNFTIYFPIVTLLLISLIINIILAIIRWLR